MLRRFIRRLFGKDFLQTIIKQNQELEWAHVYHDSIRDKEWLNQLSLNIGRWAGNYAFFYLLNRTLNDYKPKRIIEFGLGESSKMISAYLENSLPDSTHTIIEHDNDWKNSFEERFTLSNRSSINILPLQEKDVNGFKTNGYQGIEDFITNKHDLYIIDGPWGSPQYSRYDIVNIVKDFTSQDEFIIILDDCNRPGEKQTFDILIENFAQKGIEIAFAYYEGVKSVAVLGSKKYKFIKGF